MIAWIDEPTWVLVEVDAPDVQLTDPEVDRRQFRLDGGELEPRIPGLDVTPNMHEAWERFCAWMERKS
jgi:hypothetical protein